MVTGVGKVTVQQREGETALRRDLSKGVAERRLKLASVFNSPHFSKKHHRLFLCPPFFSLYTKNFYRGKCIISEQIHIHAYLCFYLQHTHFRRGPGSVHILYERGLPDAVVQSIRLKGKVCPLDRLTLLSLGIVKSRAVWSLVK